MRNKMFKRIMTFVLTVVLIVSMIHYSPFDMTVSAATGITYERVADHESIDYWKGYFSNGVHNSSEWTGNNISTKNAGAIWTDKSVWVPDDSGIVEIDGVNVPVVDTGDNFLVSMSVLASNKTIRGYEYIPTSTMLVLDVSASMGNGNNGNRSWDEMVEAANKAIDRLLKLNENNLVGVVLYSGNGVKGSSNINHSTLLLPLDRYTTTATNNNGNYPEYLTANNSTVGVNDAVTPSRSGSKSVSGGTYIQGGLYRAMQEFTAAKTPKVVETGVQAGMAYTPIVVLMSDGAPTAANLDYDFSETGNHTTDLGDGSKTNAQIGFLTQLTAAYAKARIDADYEKDALFYTLGLGLSGLDNDERAIAEAVLSPAENTNDLNRYWNTYLALDNDPTTWWVDDSMSLGGSTINKNDYVTAAYKNYVTQYFEAVASNGMTLEQALLDAFQQIVDEIVLQSVYYPTAVKGGDADLGGHVVFRDELGAYMDVVDIKGFLFEDENGKQILHTGEALARNFVDGGGDLGQSSNPKPLGDELVRSVKERLGIADTSTAQNLIRSAYYNKQLYYNERTREWSNYIGWYGDADGNYVAFWHENISANDEQAAINAGAKFIYKSYGYLGEVNEDLGIKASDMMYTAIRVRETIVDGVEGTSVGEIIVEGSIPASLIPTITYQVELVEETYESGIRDVKITGTSAQFPARILYEVALRDGINPNTVAAKVGSNYPHQENDTYTFYTNEWKTVDYENNVVADTSENTFTHFEPSIENERYYYVADSVVYSDANGTVYAGNAAPEGEGYYHAYRVFTVKNGVAGTEITYIKTSSEALEYAVKDGNQWVIPAGTGKHEIVGYEVPVKQNNATGTNEFTAYPKIKSDEGNLVVHTTHYAVVTLGNNGRLRMNVEPIKKVYDEDLTVNPNAGNVDGDAVMVGDVLTYTINVTNYESETADITVTDIIPTGTVYVDGSASHNGVYSSATNQAPAKLTWTIEDVAAGNSELISFKVQVTEEALSNTVHTIDNTAHVTVTIGNNSYSFDSNTTSNQTEGKKVANVEGGSADTVKLGEVLVYSIQFVNDKDTAATVTITDVVPKGTAFVSADHSGSYNASTNTVTWKFENVQPGHSGVVTFRAVVTAEAASLSDAPGTTGGTDDTIVNYATIAIGDNNPEVRTTNETTNELNHGDMVLTKAVTGTNNTAGDVFTLTLTDIGTTTGNVAALTGKYAYTVYENNTAQNTWVAVGSGEVDFNADSAAGKMAGVANVKIEAGQYVVVEDLPAGITIIVDEDTSAMPAGYTLESIQNDSVTIGTTQITSANIASVISDSNYTKTIVNNTYSTVPASVTLVTTKKLGNTHGNVNLSGGEFSFVLKDESGKTVELVHNDKDGNVKFKTLTFDTDRTEPYKYIVSEIKGSDDNITYSGKEYAIEINVTDNHEGALKAKVTVDGVSIEGSADEYLLKDSSTNVGFSNTYTPDPIPLVLSGTKILTGEGKGTSGIALDQFSFELFDVTNSKVIATVGNAASTTLDGNGDYVAGFTFPTLYYGLNQVGSTFTYKVSEVKPDVDDLNYNPNMVYSTVEHTVEVNVGYDDVNDRITLAVTVDGTPAGTTSVNVGEFKNIQHSDTVSVVPKASKVTKNVLPGDASFSFVITDGNNNPIVYGSAPAVSAGDADPDVVDNVKFPELTYTVDDLWDAASGTWLSEKTFDYVMKEVVPGINNGITYDPSPYKFSVTVKLTEGKLEADLKYESGSDPIFRNEYNANGQLTVEAVKKLEGSERALREGEFNFVLERLDSQGNGTGIVHYGKNASDGRIVFDTLYFTENDLHEQNSYVYKYRMKEIAGNASDIKYSDKTYEIVVEIKNNNDGTITAVRTDNLGTPVFTNKVISDGKATIKAQKVIDGRSLLSTDVFTFNLYAGLSGNTLVDTTTNDASGAITFELTYPGENRSKEYYYRIVEEVPVVTAGAETNGIQYTDQVYFVKVVMQYDVNTSALVCSDVQYYNSADDAQNGNNRIILDSGKAVEFVNKYTTSNVTWTPQGLNKKLIGRDMHAGEFTFKMEDITVNSTADPRVLIGTNEAAGKSELATIVFDSVTYNKAGVYKYKVSEVVPTEHPLNGVKYDETVKYMTVEVYDDLNGSLAIGKVEYFNSEACDTGSRIDSVVFTNQYDAKPTSTVLRGTKFLDNKKLVSGEFEFKLEGHDLNLTSANDANGLFRFVIPESVLKEVGTYTFKVSESNVKTTVASSYTGDYAFDSAYVMVTVTVADDGKGQLYVANTTYVEHLGEDNVSVSGIAFLNSYKPKSISKDIDAAVDAGGLNINVDKLVDTSISGVTYDLAGFKFEVRDLNNAVVSEGTSDANGNINFVTPLTFTEAGQYRYWISEVDLNNDADPDNDMPNVTFSDEIWELHVLVRYNEETGVLHIEENDVAAYELHVGATTHAEATKNIEYVNDYEPESVTVDFHITKSLDVAQGTSRVLQNHEFIFRIEDANGNPVAETANVGTNVKFALTFDAVGTYEYKVKEVRGIAGGVTYDDAVYDVKIVVTDAELDGKLEAAVTITEQTQGSVDKIEFTNKYAATPAEVVITACKELENRPLAADEFTFELRDMQGNLVDTAQNDAAGDVSFGTLEFTSIGTYQYRLTEKKGTLDNVTYSEEVYKVTIEVKDDLQGKMIAEVTYAAVDGDGNESIVSEPTFTNIYTPDPSAVVIDATKQLTGRDLNAGEFQFVIKDETGKELATGSNTADGKIYFTEFKLPEGTGYKLYVSEVDTGLENVLYDGTTYTVLVDVANDGSGILKATVNYPEGGIVFRNEYKEPPVIVPDPEPETIMTSFAFNATKVLTGRIMAAGEFQFQVKDSKGEVVATGINEANGSIQFSPLVVFTPGRHVYTISEVKGGALDITYDTKVYTVTVDVEQVGDDLAATINYPEGGLTFRNYFGDTTPLTGDNTPIGLLIALVLISGAGVAGLLIFKRKKK